MSTITSRPENRQRLTEANLLDPTAFLVEYLIEGRPAFVPRAAPSVPETIELIHGAGGVAVWAHPFWDIENAEAVFAALNQFQDAGLDGVEAFYVTHTEDQTRLLVAHASDFLRRSPGSSDYH